MLIQEKRKVYDGPFLFKKILNSGTTKIENLNNSSRFLNLSCLDSARFLEFINNEEFLPILNFAKQFHEKDTRKVTEDPYIKHLLYTTYLCFDSKKFKEYNREEKNIFLAAALLHDTVEIFRKEDETYNIGRFFTEMINNGFNHGYARKIALLVSILTPEPKGKDITSTEWLERKLANFRRIVTIDANTVKQIEDSTFSPPYLTDNDHDRLAEMAREIKIADEAANVRETVDDIKSGKDGYKVTSNGIKNLTLRFKDFTNRFSLISSGHPLKDQLKKNLDFIDDYLKT
ncbi:MAG: hypothetical protein AAB569_05880 [Patescibacteria group bacterium]